MRKIVLTFALSLILLAGSFIPASAGVPVGSVSEYPPYVLAHRYEFGDYVVSKRFLTVDYPELALVLMRIEWVQRPGEPVGDVETRRFQRDNTNSQIDAVIQFGRIDEISSLEFVFVEFNGNRIEFDVVFVNHFDTKLPMISND